jgi:methylated-DNA-protein-cysteine methyltransferase-like protein
MRRALSSYQRIYQAVRKIPRGRVATYGDVAAMAGLPGRARQVGYALHALPDGSPVPWHRVINAAGRISLPMAAGGLEQRLRLLAESVPVDQGGRVKLTEFRFSRRRRA